MKKISIYFITAATILAAGFFPEQVKHIPAAIMLVVFFTAGSIIVFGLFMFAFPNLVPPQGQTRARIKRKWSSFWELVDVFTDRNKLRLALHEANTQQPSFQFN